MTSAGVPPFEGGIVTQTQTEQTGPHARVLRDFGLITVLQGIQIAALLFALVYWFVSDANRGEENQRRLEALQVSVSGQITELHEAVSTGLGELRQDLNALADTRARLDQAERRVAEMDARQVNLDTRTTTFERQMVDMHSDLVSISKASSVLLPGTGR
jgi:hypothetical protein